MRGALVLLTVLVPLAVLARLVRGGRGRGGGFAVAPSPPSPSSAASPALAEADGVGEAEASSCEPSSAATQSLYSSAVRLLADGADALLSATACVDVKPMPMRTAVGIAAMAIALPAGMWNLVNSGFLGAAWRGPVLPRDSSTPVP